MPRHTQAKSLAETWRSRSGSGQIHLFKVEVGAKEARRVEPVHHQEEGQLINLGQWKRSLSMTLKTSLS